MTDNLDDKINQFLASPAFAVAGASTNREKYGNKVVRVYQQNGRTVYPINPGADTVEGETAYPNIAAVPEGTVALSIITPPPITEKVVKAALERGVRQFWMQPGTEHEGAIAEAEAAGANVIHGGPCVLVALGYTEQ